MEVVEVAPTRELSGGGGNGQLDTAASLYATNEVFQHGSIDEFIGSSIDGVQSGFIRCVYTAKDRPGQVVTLLCEKMEGCCVNGCCPKDQWWMTALIIFLIFVLLVFVVGMLALIICYLRTKALQKKEERETERRQQHYYSTYEPTPYGRNLQSPMAAASGGGGTFKPATGAPPSRQQQQQSQIYAEQTYNTKF